MALWKLGCRWGSGTPLFYDFIKEHDIVIGWKDKDYAVNEYLFVTDGHTVLDIARIRSKRKSVLEFKAFEREFTELQIPFDENIFIYEAEFLDLREEDRFNYPLQQGIVQVKGKEYLEKFESIISKYKGDVMVGIVNLLKYKKQIILQGPPGTGKTKLAKEIAERLIVPYEFSVKKAKPLNILKKHILEVLKVGDTVLNKGVDSIGFNSILLTGGTEVDHENIIRAYSQKRWSNAKKDIAVALAQKIYHRIGYIDDAKTLHPEIKLLQFHPSYTYEDFVRGVVSKPSADGDGIIYEAEDKTLGKFAKEALDNYLGSLTPQIDLEEKDSFDAFIDYLKEEIAQSEDHKYNITDAVYLFSADETRFKYKGDNWVAHSKGLNMKFSELKKIINSGAKERQDIKKMTDLEELTRQHATYFIKIAEKYYSFKSSSNKTDIPKQEIALKNYVLIIDEINRANLSSVLGELIYAFEYRGEAVESMYAIEGENKLTLPPNLYIIGTMNTADRSVGHIDYAIRRRFAFVDVLPKDLSEEDGIVFDSKLFYEVSELFETNLSPEFEKKDVQLGHSYFIDKSKEGGSMDIRLQYEIKPILLEYVKDGVLIGDNIKQKIKALNPSI